MITLFFFKKNKKGKTITMTYICISFLHKAIVNVEINNFYVNSMVYFWNLRDYLNNLNNINNKYEL